MVVIDRLCVIPNDVYDYSLAELFMLYRETIDPEMQEFVRILRERQIIQ